MRGNETDSCCRYVGLIDDAYNSILGYSPSESEDRDNSFSIEGENEPGREPGSGTEDRGSSPKTSLEEEDDTLDIETVFQEYQNQVQFRMRESSFKQYKWRIDRFVRNARLLGLTRRQARARLPKLIIEHLKTVSRGQWLYEKSALKDFCRNGLRMDWPESEIRAFTGRLPSIGRKEVPRRFDVEKWMVAIEKEPDNWTKSLVLLVSEFGLRPNHIYRLKFRNLRHDEKGEIESIVADGGKEAFKTDAWVACYLPSIVKGALKELFSDLETRESEDPLIPYRHSNGRIEGSKFITDEVLRREWNRFRTRWKLPDLNPSDFRHFVCWMCEEIGLSNSASGYLCGHDTRKGETYRNWYSNLPIEDVLEEQRLKIPNGILGLLKKPEIELIGEIPVPFVPLIRGFLKGEILTLDFASQAESIKTMLLAEEARKPEL